MILWGCTLFGQDIPLARKNIGYLQTGISYQMWKVAPNLQAINQIALPTYLVYPVSGSVTFNLSQTPALSWWRKDERIISSSDTWAQLNIMLSDKAMFNIGLALPTGKTRLDTNQFNLTQAMLSRPIYQYQLPQYGQGFSAKTGISYVIPVTDELFVGTGAQYIYKSAYYPLEFSYDYYGMDGQIHNSTVNESYKPGDEINFLAGVDFLANRDLSFTLDLMYSYYSRDLLENMEVFSSGQRFMAVATMQYQYTYGKSINARLLFRTKSRNELLQQSYLQDPKINYNGAQVEFTADYKFYESGDNGMLFLFDTRLYRETYVATPANDFMIGGGVGVIYHLNPKYTLNLNAKYMFGTLNSGERDALGIITYLGLTREY